MTTTPVAVLNPAAFDTVTVKVTLLPTFGVAVLTVLVRLKSICWGVMTTLSSSSWLCGVVGLGSLFGWLSTSDWSAALT